MEHGIIATFHCEENAERACQQLRETLAYEGVTIIAKNIQQDPLPVGKGEAELDGFGQLASQVVGTAQRTGTLMGSLTGMAVVGIFSLPLLVATPFLTSLQEEPKHKVLPSPGERTKIVTVTGNSDLRKAKDILIQNGGKIYPQ